MWKFHFFWEDRIWIGKIPLRPLPSQFQKMNTNLMISLLMKNIQAQESTLSLPEPALLRRPSLCSSPHPVSIFSNSYRTLSSSIHVSPQRRLQFSFGSGIHGLQGREGQGQHKMAKRQDKSRNAPLISAVCCLPAVTPSRVQMHTHGYIPPGSLLALPALLVPQKTFLIPRPAGRRGIREGRRGCCQDAGAEGFWQMLLELPRNDCLTVPTPSRGRLVVTDSCGQICHKLPWYFPVRVLYRQQLIDSCWAIKTLDRVGRETETRIYGHMLLKMWKVDAISFGVPE